MRENRRQLRVTAEDRARSALLEIPFDVPAGSRSLEVRLGYDSSAAVIDLGCRGPRRFRGWSGGARDRFVVAAERSTPGYLTGAPEPGEWAVVLGLHRVPAAGLDVVVSISVPSSAPAEPDPPAPPVPPRRPRRQLPAPPGRTWLAADLHAHTVHSDGSLSVPELAALAVEAGLDVLAVTDHNTVSHHRELPAASAEYGVALVPGQELTTDRGHANAFGDIGWVDFRRPAEHWWPMVSGAGGLLSINHPLTADCAWLHPLVERPPLAEVWHWSWLDRTWSAPLAWWTLWGIAVVPVGGSDFHRPEQGRPLGEPVTWLACEDGGASSDRPAAVLAALAEGRTSVSAGYDAPVLLRVCGELLALDADGTVLLDVEGRRRPVRGDAVRFPAAPGPHHLQSYRGEVVAISP